MEEIIEKNYTHLINHPIAAHWDSNDTLSFKFYRLQGTF